MTLQPVTGVLKAVAQVERQDPRAARMLVQLGLFESLADQSEQVWPEIGPAVLTNMGDVVAKARSIMLRSQVGKALDGVNEPVDLEYAEGLAVLDEYVAKSLSGSLLSMFNRKHPRDGSGRFTTVSVGSQTDPNQPVDTRQSGHHQEALSAVERMKRAGLVQPDTPLVLHHIRLDPNTGRPIPGATHKITNPARVDNLAQRLQGIANSDPNTLLTAISLDKGDIPASNAKQRAALDLIASTFGPDRGATRLLNALPMDAQGNPVNQDENAAEWNRPTSPGDRQGYRRMSMTGGLLAGISAPGSTVNTVGGLAQLIGDLGPQAEKVLAPGIRRTAYRYRGTEKRPDPDLVSQVSRANAQANALDTEDPERKARVRQQMVAAAARPTAQDDPVSLTNAYWLDQRKITPDQRKLGMRGDAAVAALLRENVLPSRELTELSVESGELPPSQGVIINADGRVVTQAQGYNGDHYLPFDLRNLSSLQGGQYVRTRASGGPTTEDLYTGLLTGARQIQVVSNSGVFTVEFDPDVRGGRRYSDKALRMIQRYGKLLHTIATSDLYLQDLTPEQTSHIRRQALAAANGDKDLYQNYVNQLTERARFEGAQGGDSEDEIEEAAQHYAATQVRGEAESRRQAGSFLSAQESARIADEAAREYRIKVSGDRVRELRLDGPGYDRALKTLKQEFPFYIRQATWQPLPEWLSARALGNPDMLRRYAGSDKGYTEPGQTNAQAAQRHGAPHVPTARSTAELDREGVQADGTEPAQRKTSSAPALTGGALGPAKPKRTLQQAVSADDPAYLRAVERAVENSLAMVPVYQIPVVTAASDEHEAETAHPLAYANWKWGKLMDSTGSQEGAIKEMSRWLVKDATPHQRQQMLNAIDQLPDLLEGGGERFGFSTAGVDTASQQLHDLFALRDPFAPRTGDPVTTPPAERDPKPQRFDDLDYSADPADYDAALKQYEITNSGLASAIKQFSADAYDPDAIADQVVKTRDVWDASMGKDKVAAAQLENQQKAWSFVAARHAAQELHQLTGGRSASDAGPKVLKPGTDVTKRGRPSRSELRAVGRVLALAPPDSPVSKGLRDALLRRYQDPSRPLV